MPTGYPSLTKNQKQEIIARIKDRGEKVSDLAKEYGVWSKTIYNLLKTQLNQSNITLELAKVKRERDALLQIVGQFVLEDKARKKKFYKKSYLVAMSKKINKSSEAKKVNKTKLAKNLGIGRSSLYYKPKLPIKDLILKKQIEEILKEHKSYGHKRIALHLKINKKRALRVMKLFDLSPARKPRVPIKKDDLNQVKSNKKNLISGFNLNAPSQIWASDFTYLPYFNNKFIYLATVIDCFTKEIISWNLSVKHKSDFIVEALIEGLNKRKKPKIFHSDQGSEYKADNLNKILKSNKIKQSMSNKSSPWQNGAQESFYGKFKLELGHPKCYETIGELIEAIAGQIYYYNNKRIHTAIKCPPAVFYQRCQAVNAREVEKNKSLKI